jgi:putative transposase
MMVSFKGGHFGKDMILTGVGSFLVYPLSSRHLEEVTQERGGSVDHATINRWVLRCGAGTYGLEGPAGGGMNGPRH